MSIFRDMLNYCFLADLGFTGPHFIWAKSCRNNHFVQQRLDRIVVNPIWILKFPEVKVTHLPRIRSRHCPLLLSLDGHRLENSSRPFRLETMWLEHPDFRNLIKKILGM